MVSHEIKKIWENNSIQPIIDIALGGSRVGVLTVKAEPELVERWREELKYSSDKPNLHVSISYVDFSVWLDDQKKVISDCEMEEAINKRKYCLVILQMKWSSLAMFMPFPEI